MIKINKNPDKLKNKSVAKGNIKSKINARLAEPYILQERTVELGVLQTGFVSLPLAFFLTTSKEIQF